MQLHIRPARREPKATFQCCGTISGLYFAGCGTRDPILYFMVAKLGRAPPGARLSQRGPVPSGCRAVAHVGILDAALRSRARFPNAQIRATWKIQTNQSKRKRRNLVSQTSSKSAAGGAANKGSRWTAFCVDKTTVCGTRARSKNGRLRRSGSQARLNEEKVSTRTGKPWVLGQFEF